MHGTVDSRSPPLPYLPFPIALERLRKRLGASPQEVACWRRPKTEPFLRVVPTQN
jgi:hypothetical protein